jgi:hypothetical protein
MLPNSVSRLVAKNERSPCAGADNGGIHYSGEIIHRLGLFRRNVTTQTCAEEVQSRDRLGNRQVEFVPLS